MKHFKYIAIGIFLTFWGIDTLNAQIGQWRNHFAATTLTDICKWGNEIYAARTTDILYYNIDDRTLNTISKRNGLAGIGISAIEYHPQGNCLIIGYQDGNIDLYYGQSVYNMPDIKNKTITGGGGKKITSIYVDGNYAYLACGFGIVVMDIIKQEFRETYFVGENNSALEIRDVRCDNNNIWACTEDGLLFADKKAINLNDYSAWTKDSIIGNNFTYETCCKLGDYWWVLAKPKLADTNRKSAIYKGKLGGDWSKLESIANIDTISMLEQGKNYLVIGSYRKSDEKWSVDLLDVDGNLRYEGKIDRGYEGSIPCDAFLDEAQNLWAAGTWASIMRFDHNDGSTQTFYYWGPALNSAFTMTGSGNKLYVASGGYDASYSPIYNAGDISVLNGRDWSFLNESNISGYKDFRAITQILEDPNEPGHLYASSAVDGFIEIRNNKVVAVYNSENSPLQDMGEKTCRVYGIALDGKGSVWMINPGSSTPLLEYRKDGTWKAYEIPIINNDGSRLGSIMVDYWQHIWLIDNKENLYVFKIEGDRATGLKINPNRGGSSSITTSRVNCVIEDDLGWVWVGTDRGVKVIDKHATVFDNPIGDESSVECKYVMVPSGEFLIELLKNESITSLLYDGANRKWIGTQTGGVFLVSPDGTQEVEHFTEDNSSLISNQIISLGLTPYGGEIFFSTPYGLCSYQGTSTFREEGKTALPFPNPVPPGYGGYISIKNLPVDAEVKITDVAGHLIFEGQATGSQLSWDGYNMQGKRPQSGVLLVFAASSDGEERMVCKIFYIR